MQGNLFYLRHGYEWSQTTSIIYFGIHTAWRKAADRKEWRRVVGTTLQPE